MEADIESAARKAGISRRTLQLWLHEPAFRNEYRRLRVEVVEQCIGRLVGASAAAITALAEALQSPRVGDRIKAAHVILTHSSKGLEQVDLAEQIRELREQLQELRHGRGSRIPTSPVGRGSGNDHTGAGGPDDSRPGGDDPSIAG
jgi:hypothetical protein